MHQSVSCVQGFGSCSGETAHREQEKSEVQQYCRLHDSHTAQLTISLSFFIGRARTVLDAGLALKVHGSFVNGLTPFRAGWAGFFFSFMFKAPASLNWPFFLSSPAATSTRPSTTSFTSFALRPVVSATEL